MNEKTLALEILKRDVDVNTKDRYGSTALNYASKNTDLEVMKLLINRGADINSSDASQRTPAHYAAQNSNVEVLKLLKDKEASME